MTTPDVFIIESLRFENEERAQTEGAVLSHVLRLARRKYKYYYIRTRVELEAVLDKFQESGFRYLHISCHADPNNVELTLEYLSIAELGEILRPYIDKRRVFFSACQLASNKLASTLLKETTCYSVVAPSEPVDFGAAALFWASLYHLMFKGDRRVMTRKRLTASLKKLSETFSIRVRYFSSSPSTARGFREVTLRG